MDNKTKKKLDAKRVALTQRYEVNYLKRTARKLIKLCEKEVRSCKRIKAVPRVNFKHSGFSTQCTTLLKLAKALLKCLDKINKK